MRVIKIKFGVKYHKFSLFVVVGVRVTCSYEIEKKV